MHIHSVFSVVINGKVGSLIIPRQGLRQGFPLSLYLFLLCAEGFSILIRGKKCIGLLKRFSCCPKTPFPFSVSHLFFANDSLLFCETSASNCIVVRTILTFYGRGSGQRVNMEKSMFVYSRDITEELADKLSCSLRVPHTVELEWY